MDISTLFSLRGKVALVTGGSRGIGLMIAEGLLQAGATVYISSRKKEVCDNIAKKLSSIGTCIALPADVSTPEGRATLITTLAQQNRPLHILINNAGASWGASYETYPESAFDKLFALNVSAAFFLTRDLTSLLQQSANMTDPARVINIGSMDGLHVPQLIKTGTFLKHKIGTLKEIALIISFLSLINVWHCWSLAF